MPQANLTKQSVHGVLWMGASKVGLAISRLAVLAILARWITPEEFGTVGLVLMIIGFSEIVAGVGVPQAIVQRKDLTDGHIASGFIITFGLNLFFALFLLASSGMVVWVTAQENLLPLLRVAAVLFPIKAIDSVYRSILLSQLNFKAIALVEVVSYSIGYGLIGVTLALLGFDAMTIVLATIAQYLLSSLMLWKMSPKIYLLCADWKSSRELLSVSLGFSMTNVAFFLSQSMDKFIVFLMFGVQAMGLYGRALALSHYPGMLIGQPLDQVIFPVLSTCQDDTQRLKRAFLGGFTLLSSTAWPITIPLVVASREIIFLVLGPQWEQAVPVFQVLILISVVRFSNKINDSLIRAKGAVYRCAWRHWFYLTMMGIWCWIGSYFGLVGVAIGAGIACFINYVLMLHLTLQLLGVGWGRYFTVALRPLCVYSVVLAGTLLAASNMRDMLDSGLLVIAMSFLVPFLLYGLLITISPGLLLGTEAEWTMNALWKVMPQGMRSSRLAQRILCQKGCDSLSQP